MDKRENTPVTDVQRHNALSAYARLLIVFGLILGVLIGTFSGHTWYGAVIGIFAGLIIYIVTRSKLIVTKDDNYYYFSLFRIKFSFALPVYKSARK